MADTPSPRPIQAMENLGYTVLTDGQINIIGIRSKETKADSFNDEMHLIWVENGLWQHRKYRCTCDPGAFWLENPSRVDGTAILVPGQYVDAYKLALHQGRYKALCQRNGKVNVWRDSNKDSILDWEKGNAGDSGYYGINIHHAGANSTQVGRWSAGCQVFARMVDWNEALKLWEDSGASSFTYTLITEEALSYGE